MWNLKMVVNRVQDLGPKENTAIPVTVHVSHVTFVVLLAAETIKRKKSCMKKQKKEIWKKLNTF
jgi:hypothetical protein